MAPKVASKSSAKAGKAKPKRIKLPATIVEEDSDGTTASTSSVGADSAGPVRGSRKSKAELSKTYQKLEHREQILLRPDSYVGSIENERVSMHVLTGTSPAGSPIMELKELLYNPGLYKIVDEIIVNARDHHIRSLDPSQKLQTVTEIRLDVDGSGRIAVFNNGAGIDVEMHPEHGVYIPELIFGHLLTSTNYDDSEKRVVGGRNGYGAKLTNIFSKEFVVETLDIVSGKTYRQTFSDNMQVIGAPEIKATRIKKGFTRLTFLPDYARFGMTTLTSDMLEILRKRAYDLCACTGAKVTVFFNGERLEYKNFERYVDLYLGMKTEYPRVYEGTDRWEVAATYSDAGYRQVSFVNGICTFRGGRHVDMVSRQICDALAAMYNAKKKKDATALKGADVKQYLWLFVNATIENPRFSGQTKEELSSTQAQFGSRCELSDKFLAKLYKSGIIERAMRVSEFNAAKGLSKLGGKKKVKLNDVEKLEDANKAGGKDSTQCTLILTEGDSAKAMAVDGVSAVNGRDHFGIFPLKGKLLNVKDAAAAKIAGNKEISDVMKIVGLQVGKDPKPTDLRYGRIMILADSDEDGAHIKGLVMNLIHSMWPSLVREHNFIVSMLTPVVKAMRGEGRKRETKSFYKLADFQAWQATAKGAWKIKYYKGLGTSGSAEAKQYFQEMKLVNYEWTDRSEAALDLAFNKKRADDRKEWLKAYDRTSTLDYADTRVSYDDFVHKDLIHFSNADNCRSIPNVMDGLKESTRKILYACFKRNLREEIRVAQLAGYVSEHAAYHHGEASLHGAIINMAQDFVGANNINLLFPSGQFGSRLAAGRDAASPRYIHTRLMDIVRRLFIEADERVLERTVDDDGNAVEPLFYAPVIPMVLINGALGIGTGFSTSVPCYNPTDVIDSVELVANVLDARGDMACAEGLSTLESMQRVIDSVELKDLVPWYRGFLGDIYAYKNGFVSRGKFTEIDSHTIEITELPVGTWTDDYKRFLEGLEVAGKYVRDVKCYHSTKTIRFVVSLLPAHKVGSFNLMEELGLCSTKGLSVSNFHLYTPAGRIKRYADTTEIVRDFCKTRIGVYDLRKQELLRELRRDLHVLAQKIKFVLDVVDSRIEVRNVRRDALLERMRDLSYDMELAPELIRMPIASLTREQKDALEATVAAKEQEIKSLETTTLPQLWKRELSELRAAYKTFLIQSEAGEAGEDEEKPAARPRTTKKVTKKKK
jgi:DNA topoisomerase-2